MGPFGLRLSIQVEFTVLKNSAPFFLAYISLKLLTYKMLQNAF